MGTNCAATPCDATDYDVCCTPNTNFAINAGTGAVTENTCIAYADAGAWTAVKCASGGTVTSTTVTGLGTMTATAGYASCTVTCPVVGQAFVVVTPTNVCTCTGGTATLATGTTAGTLCDVAGEDCSACTTGYTISATAAAGSQTCVGNPCSSHIAAAGAGNNIYTSSCSATDVASGSDCTLSCSKEGFFGTKTIACTLGTFATTVAPTCAAVAVCSSTEGSATCAAATDAPATNMAVSNFNLPCTVLFFHSI